MEVSKRESISRIQQFMKATSQQLGDNAMFHGVMEGQNRKQVVRQQLNHGKWWGRGMSKREYNN